MTTTITPAAQFTSALEREVQKQNARKAPTNVTANYRAYAVANAYTIWTGSYGHITDPASLTEAYKAFHSRMVKGSKLVTLQRGTAEGYGIVMRMVERVGINF